jgi:hypothetical protein
MRKHPSSELLRRVSLTTDTGNVCCSTTSLRLRSLQSLFLQSEHDETKFNLFLEEIVGEVIGDGVLAQDLAQYDTGFIRTLA